MTDSYAEIRTRLHDLMQDRQCSVYRLSKLSGVDHASISKLLRLEHSDTVTLDPRFVVTLRRLSLALDQEACYLEGDMLDDSPHDTFGQRLRKARLRRGMGRRTLDQISGVNEADIWKIEEGTDLPSREHHRRTLASVLGIPYPG